MKPSEVTKKLPVTVLSGFLGSGKTTLLNYILNDNSHKMKIAVIVNDMSELNVDAKLIQLGDKKNNHSLQKMVEMSNGCICCTLQPDLIENVAKLAKEQAFDYLIIESTGISEPLPVAQTFSLDLDYYLNQKSDETAQSEAEERTGNVPNLRDLATLDTMVTVVDCKNFLDDFTSSDTLKSRNMESEEGDERSVVNLLVDQVEFANVIILNKIDLVSRHELNVLKTLVGNMNPEAEILEASYGRIDLTKILNTGKFDFEKSMLRKDWIEELEKKKNGAHTPETLEYGITSFIYRRKRPFHPKRLAEDFITNEDALENVLRSKGFFWLCTKMEKFGLWHQAGDTLRVEAGDNFLAAIVDSEQSEEDVRQEIQTLKEKGLWDDNYGDRRQELVFIGIKMNQEKIIKLLDSCLLTDDEMSLGEEKWAEFEDPIELEFEDEQEHEHDENCDHNHETDEEEEDSDNNETEEQEDDESHYKAEKVKTILLGNKKRKQMENREASEEAQETKKQKK
jgi:G3E family GTPase